MPMMLIATRTFDLDGFECRERLYRHNGECLLQATSAHPDEPAEAWSSLTTEGAFDWLTSVPEQIRVGAGERQAAVTAGMVTAGVVTGAAPKAERGALAGGR